MKTTEKAVSLDEYIRAQSTSITADELRGLRKLVTALESKQSEAAAQGHVDLSKGIAVLGLVLTSRAVTEASDPLPDDLAETGAALRYVLKGVDIIPDSLPEIGLADDAWIVARVLERNPRLHERLA